MLKLLDIAEWLCGPAQRASVVEPLLADWQRELEGASGFTRWWIVASGCSALAVTLVMCLVTGGSEMPRVPLIKGFTVFVLSTALLLAVQIGLNLQQFRRVDFPFEMRFWMALPLVLPLAVPLAMLPIMMLMRGTSRVSARAAAIVVIAGGLLTLVTTGWLTPLSRGDIRDGLYEEIERRTIANEQAGIYTSYSSAAARQARRETPEQRAKKREAYRSDPRYLAYQADITRPRWNRSTFMMAGLAVALGALGWALGGLGRTRVLHAAGWWSLAWLAVMILDGRAQYWVNGGVVRLGRAPYWVPVAVFATAALAALIASRRLRRPAL